MLPHLQIFVLDEVAHFGFPRNRDCMLVSLNSKTLPSLEGIRNVLTPLPSHEDLGLTF